MKKGELVNNYLEGIRKQVDQWLYLK